MQCLVRYKLQTTGNEYSNTRESQLVEDYINKIILGGFSMRKTEIFSDEAFAFTGTTFTSAGNNFVYSDNPEAFSLSTADCTYLYGTSLGSSFKDVEFYHILYNSYNNSGACRVGVAIRNSNASSTTITYKGSCTATLYSGDSSSLDVTPSVLVNFQNASYSTLIIPAYGSAIVYADNFNFTPNYPEFVYGRAQFSSSQSSNVWLRVFAAGQTKTANDVFNIASPVPGNGGGQFCGELGYTQKNTTLSATSGNTTTFCEWPISLNTNEYTDVINAKTGGLTLNAGNYGVVYNITVTNASGKNIKITPRWSGRTKASIVYSINNGAWTSGSTITSNMCWLKSLGTGATANVRFILPGGNGGNYDISFQ